MSKPINVVSSVFGIDGLASVANLLNKLEKTESRSLAWPTTKKKSTRSFNRTDFQEDKITSVKSKFFNLLKLNERKHILENESHAKSIHHITSSSKHPLPLRTTYSRSKQAIDKTSNSSNYLYKVPGGHSLVHEGSSKSPNIRDAILKMLREISYSKPQELKLKSRQPSVTSVGEMSSLERKLSKKKNLNILKRRQRKKRSSARKSSLTVTETEITNMIPVEKSEQDVLNMNKIVKPHEMNNYLKTISKISPLDESSGNQLKLKYKKLRLSKQSKEVQNDDFKTQCLSLSLKNNIVTPTVLGNVRKSLRIQDTNLFSRLPLRSVNNERISPISQRSSLAQLLKRKHKKKNAQDDISRDLENIEQMVSRGITINQSRKVIKSLRRSTGSYQKSRATIDLDGGSIYGSPPRRLSGERLTITSNYFGPLDTKLQKSQSHISLFHLHPKIETVPGEAEPNEVLKKIHHFVPPLVSKPMNVIDWQRSEPGSYAGPLVRSISQSEIERYTQEGRPSLNISTGVMAETDKLKFDISKFHTPPSSSSSLLSIYNPDKIMRFFTENDMHISEMDDVPVTGIEIERFLHYPYDDKYYADSNTAPSRTTAEELKTTRKTKDDPPNFKQKVQREVRKIRRISELKKQQDKVTKDQDDIAKNDNVMETSRIIIECAEPIIPPEKDSCCICSSMHRYQRVKDDPLIAKMKRELKRHELRAYIKENQVYRSVLDEICNDISFDFEKPKVLSRCDKSNIAKVVYGNIV